jgi:hypothetical protein
MKISRADRLSYCGDSRDGLNKWTLKILSKTWFAPHLLRGMGTSRVFWFLGRGFGLSGAPRVIDSRQIGCPGVQIVGVYEGSFAKLPRDKALSPDFFTQLGQADAGCLSCFVDAVRDTFGH